jgi:hypothetical protein
VSVGDPPVIVIVSPAEYPEPPVLIVTDDTKPLATVKFRVNPVPVPVVVTPICEPSPKPEVPDNEDVINPVTSPITVAVISTVNPLPIPVVFDVVTPFDVI